MDSYKYLPKTQSVFFTYLSGLKFLYLFLHAHNRKKELMFIWTDVYLVYWGWKCISILENNFWLKIFKVLVANNY